MSDGPEKKVENAIKKQLEEVDAYFLKNFASPLTPKGHPDITAVIPKNRGKLIGIEVKKPYGGEPTPVQIRRLSAIVRNGGRAVITAEPKTVQYLMGDESIPVKKVRIKEALSSGKTIWTKRDEDVNIIEIIK